MTSIILSPDVAPVTPEEGEIYYDSSSDKLKLRDASGFREVVSENSSGEIEGTFVGTVSSSATVSGTKGGLNFGTSTFDGTVANTATLPSFVGMIAPFAMSTPPTGWLSCDGSAVSRATYADLFAAIGTTWGSGNGNSTFNIPDLRGAFLRGTGSHGSRNMVNGNAFSGQAVGGFENDQLHRFRSELRRGSQNTNGTGTQASLGYNNPSGGTAMPVGTLISDGYGTPRSGDETRPFNASVKYCIKF